MNVSVIIYYSWHIDKDFEVTCFFLDIAKSFIEVWHKIFIYKLKQNANLC